MVKPEFFFFLNEKRIHENMPLQTDAEDRVSVINGEVLKKVGHLY